MGDKGQNRRNTKHHTYIHMRIDTKSLVKKLDSRCFQHLEAAVNLAVQQRMSEVTLVYWLGKMLNDSDSEFCVLLKTFDIEPLDFLKTIEPEMYGFRGNHIGVPMLSSDIKNVIYDSWLLASVDYQSTSINSGHVFLCIVSNVNNLAINSLAKTLLKGVDPESLKAALKNLANLAKENGVESKAQANEYCSDPLKRFTVDLLDKAKTGLIDRAIGRNNEMQQIIDVLCRRKQNNPILVGEAGTGKTAIVEELAFCILEKNVPDLLKDASLRLLDFAALQAGANVQGEFESRIKDLLNAVQKSPRRIILFIDEIHNFLGATGKGADAANLLKPALSKGLSLIGATTWAEYKKSFEKDAALNRRFQLIKVLEPSEEMAIGIIGRVAYLLEQHHGTHIKESAIFNAVDLSVRYMNHLRLPDKAVSLLDSACTRIKLQQSLPPVQVRNMSEALELKKSLLFRYEQDFFTPSDQIDLLRQEIKVLEEEYLANYTNWIAQVGTVQQMLQDKESGNYTQYLANLEKLKQMHNENVRVYDCVDGETIADIVSGWTGIPVSKRGSVKEFATLLDFENQIKKRVIGQDHAIEEIADAIRISKAQMSDPCKPIGVFLLVGESGVGKTETALSIAQVIYGHERKMITINMSEYKEGHKVASLIGAPPGYVGFGEGGRLTEQVRRNPYCVILLDEIEKAHPNIQDLFLQVFDKGVLTDSEGIEVDFKNTVIIMTSNLGAKTIAQFCSSKKNNTDSAHEEQNESELCSTDEQSSGKEDAASRGAQFEDNDSEQKSNEQEVTDSLQVDDNAPEERDFSLEEIQSLKDVVHDQLLKFLKPEFLGRITVVPYLSLNEKILKNIIKLQLLKLSARLQKAHGANLSYDGQVVEKLLLICCVSPIGARQIEQTIFREILPDLSLAILDLKSQNMSFESVILSVDQDCFTISIAHVKQGVPMEG